MKTGARKKDSLKRSNRLLLAAIISIAVLVLAGLFLYPYLRWTPIPRAAIVDQLSSSRLTENVSRYVNDTFINLTRNLLNQRFSETDYYSDNATLDSYRRLSSSGYKLIVWRAHSALDNESMYTAICSSEQYYGQDYDSRLTLCSITGDSRLYLAITPDFITDSMYGRFEDTVIVFMSCNGLKPGYTKTAQAFKEKGVKALLSWDGWIGSQDNDHATALLLSYLISENNTISEAVSRIPIYNSPLYGRSQLLYYPHPEAAGYRIPTYNEDKPGSFAATTSEKGLQPRLEHARLPKSADVSRLLSAACSSTNLRTDLTAAAF